MNPKILIREAREVRLRNAAACLGWQNHGLYRVSCKVRAFYRGESAVLPKPKHHLERALDPKRNGADAIIDEFAEALKLYLPDEVPRQPLRVAYKSTLKLIECGIEAVHRHCCLNKLETLLADMRSYFTHPKPDTTPEEHGYWVDHFRKLWKQGCYAISDAFYNFTTEAINRREEVARGVAAPEGDECAIAKPDPADRKDCVRFLKETYAWLREHYKSRIHSETDAINYILLDAKDGDMYYSLCKTAREIKDAFHWERGTFLTYCKTSAPKPKGLKRAAKGRAKRRLVARELKDMKES